MYRINNSPMFRSLRFLTLLILFTVSFLSNVNALEVEGHISEDTTWSPANNPYQVTENLVVDIGVTLTILPGTEVQIGSASCTSYTEWSQNFSLYQENPLAKMIEVNGRIIAQGTEESRISFSRLTDESNHCWGTIYSTPYSELSIFEYCDIEDSAGMIIPGMSQVWAALEFNNGDAIIRNCLFKNNRQPFHFSSSAQNAEIVNNRFTYDNGYNSYINSNLRGIYLNPSFSENIPLIAGNSFLKAFSLSIVSSYFVDNYLVCSVNGEADDKPMYFYNNEIVGNWDGINTDGNSANYIKNNTISNVAGIEVEDSYTEIIGNQLNNSRIRVYNSPSSVVSHNVIENGYGNSPSISANCGTITNNILKNGVIGFSGSATAQFSNNLIVNNEDICSSFSDNSNIVNQIIVGNEDIFQYTDSVHGYPVFRNCILDFELPEGCIDGGGNQFIDPSQIPNLFVDVENEDFHLASGSLALDAGFNTPGYYPFDLDYNQRVYDGDDDGNARIDIGPYEYGAPQSGKLCGFITDSGNGDPVDYVFISIDNDPGNYTFADSSGYFEMHLPEGTYDLYAKRIFHEENIIYTVTVENEEITEVDFNMSSILDPVEAEEEEVPDNNLGISLSNYPNPFNPSTEIRFQISDFSSQDTSVEIFNVKGQKINAIVCHGERSRTINKKNTSSPSTTLRMTQAGSTSYSVTWNGTDINNKPVSSGIYFATLKSNNRVLATTKMILLK